MIINICEFHSYSSIINSYSFIFFENILYPSVLEQLSPFFILKCLYYFLFSAPLKHITAVQRMRRWFFIPQNYTLHWIELLREKLLNKQLLVIFQSALESFWIFFFRSDLWMVVNLSILSYLAYCHCGLTTRPNKIIFFSLSLIPLKNNYFWNYI